MSGLSTFHLAPIPRCSSLEVKPLHLSPACREHLENFSLLWFLNIYLSKVATMPLQKSKVIQDY
jgi:hypothetical protein